MFHQKLELNMTLEEIEKTYGECTHLYAGLYDMGDGIVLVFSNDKIILQNNKRVRVNGPSKYLVRIMYFVTGSDLLHYFKYKQVFGHYNGFRLSDTTEYIIDDVSFGDKSDDVLSKLDGKYKYNGINHYHMDGELIINCRWIRYNNYEFYFFEHNDDYILRGYCYYF